MKGARSLVAHSAKKRTPSEIVANSASRSQVCRQPVACVQIGRPSTVRSGNIVVSTGPM